MKKLIFLLALIIASISAHGQGVSFSYLFPKNSKIAAPISPFSIRGIGIGEKAGIETGATLYFIPGLPIDQLPFSSEKALMDTHYAILSPVELFFRIQLGKTIFKGMAGGFGWWSILPKINEGNLDRAIRSYENWDVANSNFELKNKLGFGWIGGFELEFKVSRKFSLTTEIQYLSGKSNAAISGDYAGGNIGESIETKSLPTTKGQTLLQGLEISIGGRL